MDRLGLCILRYLQRINKTRNILALYFAFFWHRFGPVISKLPGAKVDLYCVVFLFILQKIVGWCCVIGKTMGWRCVHWANCQMTLRPSMKLLNDVAPTGQTIEWHCAHWINYRMTLRPLRNYGMTLRPFGKLYRMTVARFMITSVLVASVDI